MKDLIDRQAAIDAIKEDKIDLTNPNVVAVFKTTGDFEKVETQVMTCDRHIEILKDLPSAQPEKRTDKCTEMHTCDLIDRQPSSSCDHENDTISRTAAIDALDKRFDSIPMEQTAEILQLRKDLRELPSAQPERMRGRWIPNIYPDVGDGYRCSQCGAYHVAPYKFCHNCGADMRGGQNG